MNSIFGNRLFLDIKQSNEKRKGALGYFLHQEIDFLTSKSRFLYKEIAVLLSRIRFYTDYTFLDIIKYDYYKISKTKYLFDNKNPNYRLSSDQEKEFFI